MRFPFGLLKATTSFPRRRESSKSTTPRSGQNLVVVPLRGNYLINWIPAFAGMTGFYG
jgi:hypothetical protein